MPPRVAPEKYDLVREIVKAEPDLTIAEVAWEFHRRTGRSVTPAAPDAADLRAPAARLARATAGRRA